MDGELDFQIFSPSIFIYMKKVIISEKILNQIKGGLGDKLTLKDIAKKHKVPTYQISRQIKKGAKVEMEHTNDKKLAQEIAKDHTVEMPDYYTKLDKIEKS